MILPLSLGSDRKTEYDWQGVQSGVPVGMVRKREQLGRVDMAKTVTVAFWNRNRQGNRDRQVAYLESCAVPWDVLLLAEMTGIAFRDFRDRLGCEGRQAPLGGVDDRRYPHGVAVLARNGWQLGDATEILGGYPADDIAPRSERSVAVPLLGGSDPVTLAVWHAPAAAEPPRERGRRRKQRAYQDMDTWLRSQPQEVVLGVDGNNWYEAETHPDGRDDPVFDEEHAFHADPTSHGLIDGLRSMRKTAAKTLHPGGPPLAVTKVVPSGQHRMDRIYVTKGVKVLDAGVEYEGQQWEQVPNTKKPTAGSDHALVWARLRIP